MRRKVCFLTAGVLAVILAACNFNGNADEAQKDIEAEEEVTAVKPVKEREKSVPVTVTEENLEYYSFSDGSSSVCERGGIYKYKGEFIFIADYFNCGDERMETYPLSEEEIRLFLEEANVAITRAEEKKEEKEKEDEEPGDGGSSTRAGVAAGGNYYSIWLINFDALGISMTDAYRDEYPTEEEAGQYKIEGFLELQEKTQWDEGLVFIGGTEFQRSVGKQIEEQSGGEISRMEIDSFGDEDFVIKAEAKSGDSYRATVTYLGYVAKVEKE